MIVSRTLLTKTLELSYDDLGSDMVASIWLPRCLPQGKKSAKKKAGGRHPKKETTTPTSSAARPPGTNSSSVATPAGHKSPGSAVGLQHATPVGVPDSSGTQDAKPGGTGEGSHNTTSPLTSLEDTAT
jgi:hypothetical protein